MLKIAVLSRGPSFAVTWRKVDPHGWGRLDAEVARIYQEVIGVNDIPTSHAVDWWVFRDYISMEKWAPEIKSHFPQIFTGPHVMNDLVIGRHWDNAERLATMKKQGRVIYDYELETPMEFPRGPEPNKWSSWSGIAALGFAYHRIQKYRTPHHRDPTIDCYGVDLSGTLDVFGNSNTSRDDDRWARELVTWDAMVEVIHKAGITVNRITPDDPWQTT